MRTILLVVAGLTVLTVSCRAEVNTILEVAEDGSGRVAAEVGADDEFLDLLDTFGQDPGDLLDQFGLDIPGAETYDRTEGDLTYLGVAAEFDDINDFDATAGAAAAVSLFDDFSFDIDDESAAFRASIDLPTDVLAEVPLDLGEITQDIFSANFILDMPGTVVEHNADSILSDGRLRWRIPITGGDLVMVAQSDLGSGGSLWWLWVIIVAVVLFGILITVLAIVIQRRESRRAVDSAAARYPEQIPLPPEQRSDHERGSAADSTETKEGGEDPPPSDVDRTDDEQATNEDSP